MRVRIEYFLTLYPLTLGAKGCNLNPIKQMKRQVWIRLTDDQDALAKTIQERTCMGLVDLANVGVRKVLSEFQETGQITTPVMREVARAAASGE